MKIFASTLLLLAALPGAPAFAQAACQPGTYAAPDGDFVVLAKSPAVAAPAVRYQFRDGRRGATSDADLPLTCGAADISVTGEGWKPIAFRETHASFETGGPKINGIPLATPAPNAEPPRPLMVNGSER